MKARSGCHGENTGRTFEDRVCQKTGDLGQSHSEVSTVNVTMPGSSLTAASNRILSAGNGWLEHELERDIGSRIAASGRGSSFRSRLRGCCTASHVACRLLTTDEDAHFGETTAKRNKFDQPPVDLHGARDADRLASAAHHEYGVRRNLQSSSSRKTLSENTAIDKTVFKNQNQNQNGGAIQAGKKVKLSITGTSFTNNKAKVRVIVSLRSCDCSIDSLRAAHACLIGAPAGMTHQIYSARRWAGLNWGVLIVRACRRGWAYGAVGLAWGLH
jgi:hypothetical protein